MTGEASQSFGHQLSSFSWLKAGHFCWWPLEAVQDAGNILETFPSGPQQKMLRSFAENWHAAHLVSWIHSDRYSGYQNHPFAMIDVHMICLNYIIYTNIIQHPKMEKLAIYNCLQFDGWVKSCLYPFRLHLLDFVVQTTPPGQHNRVLASKHVGNLYKIDLEKCI